MTPLELAQREILNLRHDLETVTFERDEALRELGMLRDARDLAFMSAAFNLTRVEANMVSCLAQAPGFVTKERLHNAMYDRDEPETEIKIVDVFICKIRKKMGEPTHIKNLWGRGYELTEAGRAAITARLEALKAARAPA